jgi:hypothetical protein
MKHRHNLGRDRSLRKVRSPGVEDSAEMRLDPGMVVRHA